MWLIPPFLPRRKTCRWSRKSQMPFYPRTDTSLTWFLSTMMWMRAWRAWRKPWSEPPPPHSGCLCPGCTDTRLAPPSLCLLKGSAISVFKIKIVMGVPGVYGVNVWFKSLRYFAHMHPKNISNMYVKVYSRKWSTSLGNVFFFGLLWVFRKLCFRFLWLYGIAVPHILWLSDCEQIQNRTTTVNTKKKRFLKWEDFILLSIIFSFLICF